MNSLKWIGTIFFVLIVFFPTHPIFAQEQKKEEPWTGILADGTKINHKDLKRILADHEKWVNTDEKEGKKANLEKAKLQGIELRAANLKKAGLMDADLKEAELIGAKLMGADLRGADLERAEVGAADLTGAHLDFANLQRTRLYDSILKGANLSGANLGGAYLRGADLEGAVFEIKSDCLPNIPSIAKARHLSSVTFEDLPHSLVALREAFKKSGLRKQEREITYAIKHSGFIKAKKSGLPRPVMETLESVFYVADKYEGNSFDRIEAYLGWFFFELTCKWGMVPERPLFILAGLIVFFSIFYILSLIIKNKKDGIWKYWIKERSRKDIGNDEPELLTRKWGSAVLNGFYFSILSAFHIGWRDLNVGNWIARIQPREYTLRASGWVRVVSGIQSLISVYLFALTILTYFGRPFESY